MSSEVKRYNIYISESGRFERHEFAELIKDEDVEGEFVLYADYESTHQALAETKAQLEALEDWVERRFELVGKSVIQPQRGIVNGGFDAPFKAITNSQARRKAIPYPYQEP